MSQQSASLYTEEVGVQIGGKASVAPDIGDLGRGFVETDARRRRAAQNFVSRSYGFVRIRGYNAGIAVVTYAECSKGRPRAHVPDRRENKRRLSGRVTPV